MIQFNVNNILFQDLLRISIQTHNVPLSVQVSIYQYNAYKISWYQIFKISLDCIASNYPFWRDVVLGSAFWLYCKQTLLLKRCGFGFCPNTHSFKRGEVLDSALWPYCKQTLRLKRCGFGFCPLIVLQTNTPFE